MDCDWVLASPYISRHHATVRFAEGTFFIESTGENGVAMNSPDAMLPQLERRALKNGDRLFIDDLEIHVLLEESGLSRAVGEGAFGSTWCVWIGWCVWLNRRCARHAVR